MTVPDLRIRTVSSKDTRKSGRYVLYWMTAFRRVHSNFSLDRALEWCRRLDLPLVIFEGLRCDYHWASDRLHRFVLDGMAEKRRQLADAPATYFPYVEPQQGAGRGLLEALAAEAAVVVADDYPCFFLPRMVEAAGQALDVKLEAVDSNGLLPLRAAPKVYSRAYLFRRFVHENLFEHLDDVPSLEPLAGGGDPLAPVELPDEVRSGWPEAPSELLDGTGGEGLDALPIDHQVRPVDEPGGGKPARERLEQFITEKLERYDEDRNKPSEQATSRLSPYLHFGFLASHEIFHALVDAEGWKPDQTNGDRLGKNSGFWGMSESAEGFVDQFLTWRELGFNMCWQRDDYTRYESLPDWALTTLAEHEDDDRQHCYDLEQFEAADTHDELWNAAQRQLVREGHIHNYLRMLWGKKILHWTANPQEALAVMIELNNKYGLDGRDPNSYSGIFWTLGRYDRAWGPERPIFGKVRYMTSQSTRRKYNVTDYLEKYAP